jgi:hypothetical protein
MEVKTEESKSYPPITKELLIKGIDFTEDVVLSVYEATVKVRPLRDVELYELLDMAEKNGCADLLNKEALKKKDLAVLIKATKLLETACKMAVVFADLPRIDLPEVRAAMKPEEVQKVEAEIANRVKLFKGLSTVEIGIAILELSVGSMEGLKTFQKAQQE